MSTKTSRTSSGRSSAFISPKVWWGTGCALVLLGGVGISTMASSQNTEYAPPPIERLPQGLSELLPQIQEAVGVDNIRAVVVVGDDLETAAEVIRAFSNVEQLNEFEVKADGFELPDEKGEMTDEFSNVVYLWQDSPVVIGTCGPNQGGSRECKGGSN